MVFLSSPSSSNGVSLDQQPEPDTTRSNRSLSTSLKAGVDDNSLVGKVGRLPDRAANQIPAVSLDEDDCLEVVEPVKPRRTLQESEYYYVSYWISSSCIFLEVAYLKIRLYQKFVVLCNDVNHINL